jgi:hypothetical protein
MPDPGLPPLDPMLRSLFDEERARGVAPSGSKGAAYARVTAKIANGGSAMAASTKVAGGVAGKAAALGLTFAIGAAAGSAVTTLVAPRAPTAAMTSSGVAVPPSMGAPPSAHAEERPLERHELDEERQILDRAESALRGRNAGEALAATAEHARRFPSGQLAAERDALYIQALVLEGHVEQARRETEDFHARYPNSVFGETVDMAVGAHSQGSTK